jgi:methyltransferase
VDLTLDPRWTLPAFTGLVFAVGVVRVVELTISQRRRAAMRARGAAPVPERHFLAMVVLHTGILLACLAEAWLSGRPAMPWLALPALAVLLGATLLRWWVIATLGPHWNVKIMASLSLGVVTGGPYRFVRHPNYVAVFLELAALPLVHSAYFTALVGAAAHLWVLAHRIRAEDEVLLADPVYRAAMGAKPRFLPRLLRLRGIP